MYCIIRIKVQTSNQYSMHAVEEQIIHCVSKKWHRYCTL